MDARVKVDAGTVEYYLNRLIQRAIVEPKPLLRIYEEECQRHADISVTVSFKEFQAALQKHCMTLQSRNQQLPPALQAKHQEMARHAKELNARFAALGQKRRRSDPQPPSPAYHRFPPSALDRFSPQALQAAGLIYRNGLPPAPHQHPTKTEAMPYPSPPQPQPPSHTIVQPPPPALPTVEEEPPPEFIEMSSNPLRLTDSAPYADLSTYHHQQRSTPPICKTEPEPKDSSSGSNPANGAVQSSSTSPLEQSTNLLTVDNGPISPLNVRCVKCISAMVTCAVMPCGHCCLCSICGQTVLSLKQVCPVCRKSVTNIVAYTNLIYNVYR